MKYFRPKRIGELMRTQLAMFFARELEFEGSLVTITEVIVSEDLDHAKVKVSVLPTEKAVAVLGALQKMRGHYQHELHHAMNIRPMPQIEFAIDMGPTHAAIIEKDLLSVYDNGQEKNAE